MAHRGRLNVLAHNLGRAYETIFREFEGASSIEAVTTIPQGGTGDVKYHHGAQGTYRLDDGSSIIVRLESNPSHLEYVGAGRRGRDARGPDLAPGPARAPGHQRRDPGDPARRRRAPGPGRRVRDAEPAGARRLHRRRHAAHHPEQPGRLHDRPGRLALDPVGVGYREGLRRPDHPRQRRRRGGVHLRRPARVRVPAGVRPRRDDRPDRLPPLRPQRDRRAGVHAARDGGDDQEKTPVREIFADAARRAGRDDPGRDRRARPGDLGRRSSRRHQELKEDLPPRPAPSSRPAATSSTARRRRRSRPRSTPTRCAAQRGAAAPCRTASRSTRS